MNTARKQEWTNELGLACVPEVLFGPNCSDDDDDDAVDGGGRVLSRLSSVATSVAMDGYTSDNSSGWDSDDFR